MSATVVGRQLTEQHRVLQVRLAALSTVQLRTLWRLIDPDDLDGTTPGWVAAVTRLVSAQRQTSEGLSSRYLREFRVAEVGQPASGVFPTPGFPIGAVETSLMVTGPVKIREGIRMGRTVDQAAQFALASSSAAATRHILNGGRELLMGAVGQDRRARGWIRVTSFKPCAFCAMLASRGPVFKESTGSYQAHDSCRCTAEPVYRDGAAWPGNANQWADLYNREAKGSSDPLNAFRRAYEGS